MTCRECAEFLADYVGGELPPAELAVFERHLKACPNCDEYLRQYRKTIETARGAFDEPPVHAPIPEALVRAILAARQKTDD